VGETERKARLQQTALREWVPNIAFADEITEMLPLERSDFDGDSGASRAVMAALLTSLSDETRRGKSLLIATTNCPWRMGAAMRSRFVVLPVLHPLKEDYASIVVATAPRIAPQTELDAADPHLPIALLSILGECPGPRRHLPPAVLYPSRAEENRGARACRYLSAGQPRGPDEPGARSHQNGSR
jgi:hypothetical protein